MSVFEAGIHIKVFDFQFEEIRFISPVETLNMHLNLIDHLFPVMWCLFIDSKTSEFLVVLRFSKHGCIVHHLFRDASHINAGSTDAPFCSNWTWLDKVSQSYFFTETRSVSSGWDTTRTTSDHEQVVVIAMSLLRLLVDLHFHLNKF